VLWSRKSGFRRRPIADRVNLTLVNMPGYIVARGITAATFANGLVELTRLTSPAVRWIQLWRIPLSGAPADFANGSTPISPDAPKTYLLEPACVALMFQTPSEIRRLSVDRFETINQPYVSPAVDR
jgi:hypothetical protein